LRRAGAGEPVLATLRQAYRAIYRGSLNLAGAMSTIETELLPASAPGRGQEQLEELVRFMGSSTRGIELRSGGQ